MALSRVGPGVPLAVSWGAAERARPRSTAGRGRAAPASANSPDLLRGGGSAWRQAGSAPSKPIIAPCFQLGSPVPTAPAPVRQLGSAGLQGEGRLDSLSLVPLQDLVKNHLMYAVREEVEVLKEQIKDLVEKNSQLERENSLLKTLASPEQLQKFQSRLPAEVLSAEEETGGGGLCGVRWLCPRSGQSH
nr:TSC22 domain family protein 1-like [Pelodiscus sinensis]|eukprot:XP_006124706.2 TSC22 domain family protein 1-like [Pelodiscus sinensis]